MKLVLHYTGCFLVDPLHIRACTEDQHRWNRYIWTGGREFCSCSDYYAHAYYDPIGNIETLWPLAVLHSLNKRTERHPLQHWLATQP